MKQHATAVGEHGPAAEAVRVPAVRPPPIYSDGSDGEGEMREALARVLAQLQGAGVTEAVAAKGAEQARQIESQAQTVRPCPSFSLRPLRGVQNTFVPDSIMWGTL